ncbi:MAG TPA: glycosyltransferase, partial [Povalibacter sp.]|nr:glycosyltransferase [Povalibacter sp.]
LFRDALSQDIVIAAQTQADADRFLAVGANRAGTHVTGNVKFDLEIPEEVRVNGQALRAAQFAGRFVWVAGSTHDVEEDLVLQAHRSVQQARRDALLILVPRHPNRFERVRQWLASQAVPYATRSRGEQVTAETGVLLADTLGELLMLYAACDVAFVGGSLVPIGGHNLLEPAALERPVLSGPNNFNAPDIARLLFESGAALEVPSGDALATTLRDLASDPERRSQMGTAARAIVEANRGALARVMALIEPLLRKAG